MSENVRRVCALYRFGPLATIRSIITFCSNCCEVRGAGPSAPGIQGTAPNEFTLAAKSHKKPHILWLGSRQPISFATKRVAFCGSVAIS
jgi:hypothetical protein